MLDFGPLNRKEQTIQELAADLTRDDLRRLSAEMTDTILALIADCTDADVTFIPDDPDAHDAAASSDDEITIAWTLGHVIVHATASSEEAAFVAAEQARGVQREGRSRWEVPWRSVTTIEQCRQRLAESRRMCLATLDVWPDTRHLDDLPPGFDGEGINPIIRFLYGLRHADSHLGQIREIARQAQTARAGTAR